MGSPFSRREVLALALASPFAAAASGLSQLRSAFQRPDDRAPWSVAAAGTESVANIKLYRQWRGAFCTSRLVNEGRAAVAIREVVLCDLSHRLPPQTEVYGEGFQMLTQTGGTIAQPVNYSQYTDAQHYKLAEPADAQTFYNLLTLDEPPLKHLLAFTSCRRFSGRFYLRKTSLQLVIDTEGQTLGPGEHWQLEEFAYMSGENRDRLLATVGDRIASNHPPLKIAAPPRGWCSWYCFGPRVTAQQVLANLDFIAKHAPQLKYIQIDDGYQPAMGDWLETGTAFGGDIQGVLKEIRRRNFEPAIWIAPFIAEEKSSLFQRHPDWFVRDGDGKPLRSDRVTFGGWRHGPWYVLDGTHPQAQKHLQSIFQTMRREWGCTYFKLDANFWGAIHGGRFYDPRATRVEAYRRGMSALLRGSEDAFILGCNHPLWPSAGLIHGSRSSNDIKRSWERIKTTARQNLSRNWQNGRLWWNDPDAVCLTGELPLAEFQFHATAIYASGGMVLSGDDLTTIAADRLEMLRKLLPPTGVAAHFDDASLNVGRVTLPRAEMICIFNWDDQPQSRVLRLRRSAEVKDFWSGATLGRHNEVFSINNLLPHSARLLECA